MHGAPLAGEGCYGITTVSKTGMVDRYVVIGNPIAHTKSPRIHRLFAQQTAQDVEYDALLAPLGEFQATLTRFFISGGRGANITVPFKQEAWGLVSRRTVRAQRAGAVNTIIPHSTGELEGDNTDGIGLIRDLVNNHGVTLQGARVVLLGAGGAARGVLGPILDAKPARLIVANRHLARAQELEKEFADGGVIHACRLDDIPEAVDLIINATSAALVGESLALPPRAVVSHTVCYDMMYANEPTLFMQWAQHHGSSRQMDGLGMLVEQAAEAFRLWRGVSPSTGPVIAQLRREMGLK